MIKHSPCGRYLAAGSTIYKNGEVIAEFDTTGPVIALDWSIDSKYLKAVANELIIYDITRLKTIQKEYASKTEWHTTSCPLGWDTQGVPTTTTSVCKLQGDLNEEELHLRVGHS